MAEWHDSPAWKKARANAKRILDPICVQCGKHLDGNDWTIDHIHPPLDGEPDHSIENLQSMCRECNGRKQDKVFVRTNWFNPRWKQPLDPLKSP
jgi:5-methylcytosine-specific restriction endonuclease McrA